MLNKHFGFDHKTRSAHTEILPDILVGLILRVGCGGFEKLTPTRRRPLGVIHPEIYSHLRRVV